MSATEGWDVAGLRLMAAGVGFGALYLVATVYERLRGQAGLGLGDAKLLAASGAWLGVQALASVVLLATTSALAVVGGMRLSGRQVSRTTMLPFGPFLAFGTWLVWLYGAFN